MDPITGIPLLISYSLKVVAVFTAIMITVAYTTFAERRISAFIHDRVGPNRVGPFGLLQPIADGIKSILKEETDPATTARFFFFLGPILTVGPAIVTFAVIPFAAPLPTPWGVVDMIVADLPIGILYILAISSITVYGMVLGGWASNNKYAFLGALRGSAQMCSYEVALGLSLITVLMLGGNVTLTELVWQQQQLGMWFVFPLSMAFIFFLLSAFAETNRLPFDMPEAESELVTGYHTEYSGMKFSMFMIGEYAHMITASALMATLFFGGWDLPGTWDNAYWHQGQLISGFDSAGMAIAASPAWWKTLLTLGAFCAKTAFFLLVYIWVRWTVPRFRYDQVMTLGWKVLLPTSLGYVMVMAASVLVLDQIGVTYGFTYGLVLSGVSALCTGAFIFGLDRGRIITGAGASGDQKLLRRTLQHAGSGSAGHVTSGGAD
jgi:NADH-quinone oxidoreductase subunit H